MNRKHYIGAVIEAIHAGVPYHPSGGWCCRAGLLLMAVSGASPAAFEEMVRPMWKSADRAFNVFNDKRQHRWDYNARAHYSIDGKTPQHPFWEKFHEAGFTIQDLADLEDFSNERVLELCSFERREDNNYTREELSQYYAAWLVVSGGDEVEQTAARYRELVETRP